MESGALHSRRQPLSLCSDCGSIRSHHRNNHGLAAAPDFWQKPGMNQGRFSLIAIFLATTFFARAKCAPTPLQVRMLCYDVIIHGAKIKLLGGIEDINQVSSQGRFNPENDEMAFAPIDVPTTHWGTFLFTDGQTFETVPLDFELDIPGNDANQNGIYDLLEYSQAVSGVSTIGTYTDPDGGQGSFQATWTKA